VVTGCPTPKRVHGAEYACKRRTCRYCAGVKNRVLGRMLMNDARENSAPTHVMTLTTVDPEMTSDRFRTAVEAVRKRLRRQYGRCEYFLKVEFTTGQGRKSGGHRRIHAHLCVKGLELASCDEVERLVRETWERTTGAVVVEVAEMLTPAGALHYLALHHGKVSQAPPVGWSGKVERFTFGYFATTVKEARQRAKDELSDEGYRWFLVNAAGVDVGLALELVEARSIERTIGREHAAARKVEVEGALRDELPFVLIAQGLDAGVMSSLPPSPLEGGAWESLQVPRHARKVRRRSERKPSRTARDRTSGSSRLTWLPYDETTWREWLDNIQPSPWGSPPSIPRGDPSRDPPESG